MDTKIVKLSFVAPVHFGEGRLSSGAIACDAATLFSALYIEAMRMNVQDDFYKAAVCGDIAISDAFPYVDDVYYLPKPMIRVDAPCSAASMGDERADSRMRKANKKIAYIPSGCYPDYIDGSFDAIAELARFNPGESFVQTKVNLTRENKNDVEPYHVGGYVFYPGSGLYFIVRGPFDIEPLMEQLAFSGLGGERSSGFGRFEWEAQSVPGTFLTSGKSGRYVLLSSAAPTPDELTDGLLDGSSYKLVRKSGFVQSTTHHQVPQKKRDMYLFSAGSVFSEKFSGGVFDVNSTPGAHPVYRYARAMWMEV